jgi:Icc-related predicted phosphoesterase
LPRCFFVSDLHGQTARYRRLWEIVADERPHALFLGGDLLPHPFNRDWAGDGKGADFVTDCLQDGFRRLQQSLGPAYPRVFLILGNDDPRRCEAKIVQTAAAGLWSYVHASRDGFENFDVYGYACVPPTPFLLKDWERYDVSRYVDPGAIAPEEGRFSVPVDLRALRLTTIQEDLEQLAGGASLERSIFLFHSPPYRTKLDRAALDGKTVDHAPLDVHVGSIAIERFIAAKQPRVTLHGHVHESAQLTGSWRDRIGACHLFSAAHSGPELALVRFDPECPDQAVRELLS